MSKIVNFLCIILVLAFTIELQAQRSDSDDDDGGFDATDRLWFGTGLDGISLFGNEFEMGLSPSVGYKFTKNVSAGLRLPLNYSFLKISNQGISDHQFNWGIGGFARSKLFFGAFAHVEYNFHFLNERVVDINGFLLIDPDDPSKLLKQRINREQFNVGLGYNFNEGSIFSYELSIMYDVLDTPNSPFNPWTFRAGFNYNF